MIPVIEGFRIIRPLGAGRSGTTYLASHEGKEVAAKCILRGDRVDEHVMREVFIQRALRSPYCVKLQQVILTPTHLVMVLDACKGGDLYTYLKDRGGDGETVLPESLAWKILREVLLAVRYIHRRKIAHRDIKPENVLLNEPDIENSKNPCIVKLCDFGFSVVYEGPTVQPMMTPIVTAWTSPKNITLPSVPLSCSADSDESFGRIFDNHDKRLAVDIELEEVAKCTALAAVGTTAYVAPEVLDDDVPEYDPFAADIWSIGVLFYTMLTPFLPFQDPLDIGKSYKGMVERIKQGRYRRIRHGLVSEAAQNLLHRVFVVDPAERISLEEMIIIANEQIVAFSTSEVGMHKRSSEHYGKSGAFHGMSGVLNTALGSSPKRIAVPIPPPITHNLSFEQLRLGPADTAIPEQGMRRVEFAKGLVNSNTSPHERTRGEPMKNTAAAFALTFSKGPTGVADEPLSALDTKRGDSSSKNPAAAFALTFSKASIDTLPEPTDTLPEPVDTLPEPVGTLPEPIDTLPDLDNQPGESGKNPAAAFALSFSKGSIQVVDSQPNRAPPTNTLARMDSKRGESGISAATTFAMVMAQGSTEETSIKRNMTSNARNTSFAALFAQAATINDTEHCVDNNGDIEPLGQEKDATNDSHAKEQSASILIDENNNSSSNNNNNNGNNNKGRRPHKRMLNNSSNKCIISRRLQDQGWDINRIRSILAQNTTHATPLGTQHVRLQRPPTKALLRRPRKIGPHRSSKPTA
mmetsp:Transcript_19881/g.34145  ORF Transcript_19881/g.34145 Transcript_19881/m.34145 type:complete len:749 (+) Transcript_19881:289-2535(+)